MALDAGYSVLRLSPYLCVFNPVEMVRSQLKNHHRLLNIYSSQPSKVVNLVRDGRSYYEERTFCVMGYIRQQNQTIDFSFIGWW